jgi:peptide/nickel transport system permease protein
MAGIAAAVSVRQREARFGVVFWLSVGWLAAVALAALLAPVLPLPNPNAQSNLIDAGPSLSHLLGTDSVGRDELSRLVFGGRVSLLVGVASVALALVVGGGLGLMSAYVGGLVDEIANGIANLILAFPALVLLLAIVSVVGPHLGYIVLIIGFLGAPIFFRVVRASTLAAVSQEYVLAARVCGASPLRIMFREILPNVMLTAISLSFIGVSAAIIAEGALAYLGLSVRLPTSSWGNMIAGGSSSELTKDPLLTIWPSLAVILTTLAFNYAGTALQTFLDRRRSKI